MQDDELDNIINDASNQHHPPYDDKAWDRMLALLNEHLPQQKDRRRPVGFWLWLSGLLLVGITATINMLQPFKTNTVVKNKNNGIPPAATATTKTDTTSTSSTSITLPNEKNTNTEVTTTTNGTKENLNDGNLVIRITDKVEDDNKPNTKDSSNEKLYTKSKKISNDNNGDVAVKNHSAKKSKTGIVTKKRLAVNSDDAYGVNITTDKKIAAKTKTTVKSYSGIEAEAKNMQQVVDSTIMATTVAPKYIDTTKTIVAAVAKDAVQAQPPITANGPVPLKKHHVEPKGFKNKFVLLFSAGADKSYITASNPGQTKPMYGVSAAYIVNKRLRLTTGFFTTEKIYDAKPNQYKVASGGTIPNLSVINANCNIYEIPLNVYYTLAQGKKHSWFAGTGLSSIVMKQEEYNYRYISASGQPYSYKRSYSNKNTHYFSVLAVSSSYQYTLNKRVLFIAEPYLKMPLTGIGVGSVKLKSTGVLFTIGVKPFAK
jgi:hypothetical protein